MQRNRFGAFLVLNAKEITIKILSGKPQMMFKQGSKNALVLA